MKTVTSKINRVNRKLPALVVAGSCMAVLPASALELGELSVQSSLGQPLRASIAFALAPNEQLTKYCVSLRHGPTASGLPGIGRATISVANGVILLTGTTPVREPMIATQVIINCPYTTKFTREYMLFVDPANQSTSTSFAAATTTAPVPQAEAPAIASRPTAVQRRAAVKRTPIANSTSYQVRPGDSLSGIVSRIENRTLTMWPAVDLIFAANPDAFLNNDPNKLKAGSWLNIPDLGGIDPVVVDATSASAEVFESATSAAAPAAVPATAGSVTYEPPIFDVNIADVAPVVEAAPAAEASPVAVDATVSEFVSAYEIVDLSISAPVTGDVTEATTNDLQPGDVILDNSPIVAPTALTGSDTGAGIQTESPAASSGLPAWFLWLAGGGVAVILALLMFGRRLRGLFGSTPVGPILTRPERRNTDYDTSGTSGTSEIEVTIIEPTDDDGFDLLEESPTSENLILDADLIDGTGLEEGTDMDVAQDFGFAASSVLDIELPFEPAASAADEDTQVTKETEILPVAEEPTILEQEVMPEEDDYDMSVIMDATKMPQPEDATEFDLRAVEVDPVGETMISDSSVTLSEELDFNIVEQDYEDELTATQLLNKEIAEAAIKLSDDAEVEPDNDATSAMPLASVTDIEVTAQLPEADKDASEDDPTAEMPVQTRKGS